jgi:hypothetical protein
MARRPASCGVEKRLRLDLDGQEVATPPEQEVDFGLTGLRGRPVRHLVEQTRINVVGAQDCQDEAFEQGAALLSADGPSCCLAARASPGSTQYSFGCCRSRTRSFASNAGRIVATRVS